MKRIKPLVLALLMGGLVSCGGETADGNFRTKENTEIKETIDPETKASIDSVAQATDKGAIVFPVPDTLTRLLSKNRPAAAIAPLPDQVIADKQNQIKNPLYLTGDFNGNRQRDYAVQVLENDSIHMLAFLDYAGRAKEVKIATYAAQKLKEGKYSTYKLKLAPKDSVVIDYRTNKRKPLATDGVVVVEETRSALYLLQNNRFLPVQQKK